LLKNKKEMKIINAGSGVSSNRFINLTMMAFMLLVMIYALLFNPSIETLKVVLEYSFYIYGTSLSYKTIEKVTYLIKNKRNDNGQ